MPSKNDKVYTYNYAERLLKGWRARNKSASLYRQLPSPYCYNGPIVRVASAHTGTGWQTVASCALSEALPTRGCWDGAHLS